MQTNTIRDIRAFPRESYIDISLDELLTFCVYMLSEEQKEVTFEDIVVRCHSLFPDKFSLVGYPQFPDSSRVNKSWLRSRTDFKYIKGSVKSGFKVTTKGLGIVERVQRDLKRPKIEQKLVSSKISQARTREEQLIREVEKSEVFKRYLKDLDKTTISHWEFCDVLFCTLESSSQTLKDNLTLLKEYATRINQSKVIDFLTYAEKQFSNLLETEAGKRKYVGGMNKKLGTRKTKKNKVNG